MPYVVDGNNLAHALGLSNAGLADREACARTVSAFCRSRGASARIIFDGPAPDRPLAAGQGHRVSVIFSGAGPADDLILRLLADSRAPSDFTVVTSDKSLGDKARHRGAKVERAHEFARRLDRSSKGTGPPSDKPDPKETSEQLKAWLAVFDPGRK